MVSFTVGAGPRICGWGHKCVSKSFCASVSVLGQVALEGTENWASGPWMEAGEVVV